MVRELMKDTVFLAQKAQPATADDIPTADDLLDTLRAHADGCEGMASTKLSSCLTTRAPCARCSTPRSSTARASILPRKAASPCRASARPSATKPSRCSGRTAKCILTSKTSPAGPPRSSSTKSTIATVSSSKLYLPRKPSAPPPAGTMPS